MSNDFNPEFMKRAIALSRKASIEEKSGGVFGAVVVKDGPDVACGNGCDPPGLQKARHAPFERLCAVYKR
jgi:tRNA(Arg) A34 adenosine deaminase TadA